MHQGKLSRPLLGAAALGAGLLAACSGGGSSPSQGGFQLVNISVPEGAVWPINKRIDLEFNNQIDFSSVIAGSTVQLNSVGGGATAFYELAFKVDQGSGAIDPTTLVLQPFCPLEADLSDAGLQPGSKQYQLFVPGKGSSLSTIKSKSGAKLELSQVRTFFTPASIDPGAVFDDTQVGPPSFLPDGTFVRLGDGTEIPFVFSGVQHELPTELPLNFYSDPSAQVSYIVQINQAVDPSAENLTDEKVRLEFMDGTGTWQPFQTAVELESNCALEKPGAVLRLTPLGILPQDTEVRVVLAAGFTDIVGEQNLSDQADFVAPTVAVDFTSLTPAEQAADEAFEDFLVAGGPPGSFQDVTATFDTPPATWTGGKLSAAFDFQGTGGPSGTFDWHPPQGVTTFSTDLQSIQGGPDGITSQTVSVVNGFLDVNDFVLNAGSTVRVSPGQNPLRIVATGDVIIEGTIDLSGFKAKDVFTLFTPNQPELGALGPAGGGQGGTGSPLTSASDAVGGTGDGAFQAENAGGRGGETGFHESTTDKQLRRGAGGGGGRFGPDSGTTAGQAATDGDPGHPFGKGALSGGALPAQGGLAGVGAFTDADPGNDFFGRKAVYIAGDLTDIVQGELGLAFAGAGGGAGGDAINGATFPTNPFFDPATGYKDKKGAGGGGGAGQLQIIALGRIIFRNGGRIIADGGGGGTGENVIGNDHIAGSSAGGSGGHIILQSATQIDFTDGGTLLAAQEFVRAIGGIGGIDDGTQYGPADLSGGGNGGPGVVQLHVPDTDPASAIGTGEDSAIRVPTATTDLEDLTTPTGQLLVPTFGARSKARSIWIPIGSAAEVPGGGVDPVVFAFGGTDADDASLTAGQVLTASQVVVPLPPLLGPETLGPAAPAAFVDTDGFTLVLSQPSIQALIDDAGTPSDDIYLRNPALLRSFLLRLESASDSQDFDVASATYSDADVVLRVTVSTAAGSLESFVDLQGGPGNVTYELVPRFFRAVTGTAKDFIPDTGYVKVLFQAATAGPGGAPDEENPLVDWTPDINDLGTVGAGSLDFFRWEVEFNLDTTGAGLTTATQPISLEFLRVPFSF